MFSPARKSLTPARSLLLVLLLSALAAPVTAEIVLVGVVTDPAGAPLAGASAELLPVLPAYERARLLFEGRAAEPAFTATADAEGRYRLVAPEVGVWKVRVSAPGRVARIYRLLPLVESLVLPPVSLESAIRRRLVVQNADGEAVLAKLWLSTSPKSEGREHGEDDWKVAYWQGQTAENGTAELVLSAEHPYRLDVVAPGYHPVRRGVKGAGKSLRESLAALAPEPFRVVTSAGKGMADVLVFSKEILLPLARTDDEGFGKIGLGDLSRELVFFSPGGLHERRPLPKAPKEKPGEEAPPQVLRLTEPAALVGRVIDGVSEEPLPGAVVWSFLDGGLDWTVTGGSGEYTLKRPHVEAYGWVQATAAGYSWDGEAARVKAAEGPTLALRPAIRLAGVVVDEAGDPVAGVDLRVFEDFTLSERSRRPAGPFQARTDEAGRFHITGLPRGLDYQAWVGKEGYASSLEELGTVQASQGDLRWVLHRGLRGVGHVVDETDRPVAGAEVLLRYRRDPPKYRMRWFDFPEERERKATTDAAGRFELTGLVPGPIDLKASAEGFAPIDVPGLEIGEGSDPVDLGVLVLGPGAVVEGWVVDTAGNPLAEVKVFATSDPRGVPAAMLSQRVIAETPVEITGAEGRFRFTDLRPGHRFSILAQREGYVDTHVPGVIAPLEESLKIEMQQASRVSGRVVDANGAPIEGAMVSAGKADSLWSIAGIGHAESDAEGRFEIQGLEPGVVALSARAQGFGRRELSGLVVPPAGGVLEGVELVLERGATLRGRVTEADGTAAEGAFVMVQEVGSSKREGTGRVDSEGRFEIHGLGRGPRLVVARDRARRVSKNLEVSGDEHWIELSLEPGFEISGRVVDEAGAPIAEATLHVVAGGTSGGGALSSQGDPSDATGAFRISSIPSGVYRVAADHPGYVMGWVEGDVEVRDGPVSDLEIELRRGSTVVGRITGLSYDEMVQVKVYITGGGSGGKVDFEGAYRVENVPPGEWVAIAGLPGSGREVKHPVVVEEGDQEIHVDFEFGSGILLSGTLVSNEGPLAGARLHLRGKSVATFLSTAAAHDGTFFFEGLEEGQYELLVRGAEPGIFETRPLNITGDEDVLIEISTGRLSGHVYDARDGSPIEGVELRLETVGLERNQFGGRVTSDAKGTFRFGRVGEGSWRLVASRAGFAEASLPVQLFAGDVRDDISLTLQPTRSLMLQFVDTGSPGLEFVRLAFFDDSGQRVASGNQGVAADGRVEVSTAPEGTWNLVVEALGRVPVERRVTVPGGPEVIQLYPGGELRVEVGELEPLPAAAYLELWSAGGKPFRSLDWNGTLRSRFPLTGTRVLVHGVAPGAWRAKVTAADGRTWEGTAVVALEGQAELALD